MSLTYVEMRHSFRAILFLLFTLLCHTLASNPDLICPTSNKDECYPRIFVPTEEFQLVREGQSIPPGLHVRFDVVTEQYEAKVYDAAADVDSDVFDPTSEAALQVVPDEGPVDVPRESPSNEEAPVSSNAADSYGPIKPPTTYYEDLPVFEAALHTLLQNSPATELLLPALSDLRDLAGDMYWGLQLASNSEAVLELMSYAAHPLVDLERSTLATRALASTGRNNAPALARLLSNTYSPPLPPAEDTEPSPRAETYTLWDIALHGLQLNQPDNWNDVTAVHAAPQTSIRPSIDVRAYEGYVSLLSSLLSFDAEYRTQWISRVKQLAGPRHFCAKEAGSSADWDRVRKRLLALFVDHYLPSTSEGTAVSEGKVVGGLVEQVEHMHEVKLSGLNDSLGQPYCDLLRAWREACESVQRAWADHEEDLRLAGDVQRTIERAMGRELKDGRCQDHDHGAVEDGERAKPQQTEKVETERKQLTIKEDL